MCQAWDEMREDCRNEGRAEGHAEGRKEERKAMALELLKRKVIPLEDILLITRLNISELEELKQSI